ncbi:DUF4817 domain-containing protein [Trichonephila clavipes]|nr:DUF4817 domain-containing protein [Trichonephila clavipes]
MQTFSHAFFARLHPRLTDSGSFLIVTQKRERRVRKTNYEETVLNLVQSNPGTNMRAIASHVAISHVIVRRILHTNDVHLYPPLDMHPYCPFNVLFA